MEFGRNHPNPLTADSGIETHPYKFQGINYDRSQPSFTWSFPSKMSCNETCATIVTWRWRSVENRGRSLRIVCTGDMNFPAASGLMPRFCWRCMLARKQLLQTGQNEILTWQYASGQVQCQITNHIEFMPSRAFNYCAYIEIQWYYAYICRICIIFIYSSVWRLKV